MHKISRKKKKDIFIGLEMFFNVLLNKGVQSVVTFYLQPGHLPYCLKTIVPLLFVLVKRLIWCHEVMRKYQNVCECHLSLNEK